MLKIKDNEKELEKHLIKLNIMDGDECIATNVYCCIEKENKEYIKNNCIDDYLVEFFIDKNNEISYCQFPECRNEEVILDKIYDLTKANLTYKV